LFGPGVPPLPPDATAEQKDQHWFKYVYKGDQMPQLTLRAVVMGGLLGMGMAASNLYTTLQIGWAFGVAITACVMSYVLWTLMAVLSGRLMTRLGVVFLSLVAIVIALMYGRPALANFAEDLAPSYGAAIAWAVIGLLVLVLLALTALVWKKLSNMSLLENNCMQSTASAAGYSTGSTIATMFGALLLLKDPAPGMTSTSVSTWAVQPLWLVGTFTFCTGLMGVFLAIPMKRQMINHEQLAFPSGIAAAETLRSLYSASKEAVHKAYALVIALVVGAFVGVINSDEDTAKGTGFLQGVFDWFREHLFNVQLTGQYPADGLFTRNGKQLIDSGFQPSVLLIGAGMITGLRVSLTMLAGSLLLYAVVAPQMIDMDAAHAGTAGYVPSIEIVAGGTVFHVYRWALWGGTSLMVFSSLTSLAMQWRTIGRAFTKSREEAAGHHRDSAAMKNIEVPNWWMAAGMVPLTIAMVVLQIVAFNISWYAGVIAVAMSFVLSLVACRATGETDTTPIGAMGKVMQLTFALLHPKQIVPNLASAGIAANSASSSADLLTDLKSGYLLGANPRKQFIAQFIGVFFGTLAIVPIWYLMVPTKARLEKFPAPGTQSWYRVAKVLTEGFSSLPDSAKYAMAFGAALGIALPLIEKYLVPKEYRKYFPSAMGLGLSWVVPFANALAFAVGAVITWIWTMINRKNADTFNVPIASGLIAGESLIKAALAMTATGVGLYHELVTNRHPPAPTPPVPALVVPEKPASQPVSPPATPPKP
jgi:OPT family oligopeptide transporter